MKRKSITSRDVAHLAGVSQSAVSRSFSQASSVSEKTRKKVMDAARQLGYRPNTIARSLITRSSRTIAVVTYSLQNPFYAYLLEKASRFLQEQGYHLLLFFAPKNGDFDMVVDDLIRSQVEGVLMLAITLNQHQAKEVADFGIPVVIINRTVEYSGISQVGSDNYQGGYWAGRYLASQGCQRIAYLAGIPESTTNRQREEGFKAGLATEGQTCFAYDVGYYRYDEACDATRRLFSTRRPETMPDALFAANDLMAIAGMETLRDELHLSVPEGVSVIGFDDMAMSAWPSHSLTTLQQPVEQMIVKATELLLNHISHPEAPPEQIILPVTPKIRRSTRPVGNPPIYNRGDK
ncbi:MULTISPECIES: LacI family DNA-binding transcriptional regulator [Halomonas]|uniref:LacI family DNA-binding transcriptional regulator n=2 Tax=Halomonas TaxID=2745 RepID=A0ABR9F5S0_9GAMM|nr:MULTISPECIES: LacI family DNA-binding transcriptional regulator [Halomonas]MBE0401664.1 LacI family DNA-binding transcriptional regulator [Halomonas casei]PCC22723.1 LacI family transcriptional regulator [Halomonas sp. JB37]